MFVRLLRFKIQNQNASEAKENISTIRTPGITSLSPPKALYSHSWIEIVFGLLATITLAPNSPIALIHARLIPATISFAANGIVTVKTVIVALLPRILEVYS